MQLADVNNCPFECDVMNVQVVLKMDSKPKVMVFQPSMDEFKDFPRFVEHMENAGAHKIGLAKVLSRSDAAVKCFC